MFDNIQIGLSSQEMPKDVNGMRQSIETGRRDSALIATCLRQAEYNGLSGEDKYVLLAYQALVMLETYAQNTLRMAALSPVPPMVVGKPDAT